MRILIVDDHEVTRAAIRALLQTEGFDVADTRAGKGAIAVAVTFRPVVAIVDVAPGQAAGFQLACQLRALPDAPAIVLTSSVGRQQFGAGLDRHVFVAKADLCGEAIIGQLPRP